MVFFLRFFMRLALSFLFLATTLIGTGRCVSSPQRLRIPARISHMIVDV
jgi:hypothetical protein